MPEVQSQQPASREAPKLSPQQLLEAALAKLPAELATVTRIEPPADPNRTQEPRVLVHLFQLHGILSHTDFSKLPKDVLEAAKRLLPEGQKQQAQILDTMAGAGGVRSVIAENLTPQEVQFYNEGIKQLLGDAGKMLNIIIQRTKADTPEKFRQYLKDNAQSDDPLVQLLQRQGERTWIPLLEIRRQIGSDFILRARYDGKVELTAGEDPATHQATVDYVRQHPTATMGAGGDERLNELQDKREAHYLALVEGNRQPVSFLILGAGHSMRDEIKSHNAAHPNDPIRLIEILPRATAEFLKYAEVK